MSTVMQVPVDEGTLARLRHRAGDAYVYARDHWFDPSTRHIVHERARLLLSRELSAADVLDPHFGRPLAPVPLVEVEQLFPSGHGIDRPAWSVALDGEPDPSQAAQACHDEHAVWPVSFSYPGAPLDVAGNPDELVASIIPGVPYSYDDVQAYLRTYQRAYLGITHRKAGWDCFRHVEIIASGAVPLMLDAAEIPGYAMVHYPKHALANAAVLARRTGAPPDDFTRQAFRAWFERHLTSVAMARYLLHASGLDGATRVLFVDAALPGFADYQSVLTLIGLKQFLGRDCHVLHPVDYIYADTEADTASLYGRGFGYTRVVDGDLRSASERGAPVDLASFDAVVVGSLSRNLGPARDLLSQFPADRTIWVHGEDGSPTMDETHWMRSTGVNVFVRAIHTGRR